MKVNVYMCEIQAADEISVGGTGADSFLRIGEAALQIDTDAIDKLRASLTELKVRLAQEPPK